MVLPEKTPKRTHALVIGGSIAGLLAARVLVDYFDQITLIERDHYPNDPVFRPGVPQGHHIHILLVRGQRILETLFPGIKEKLLARGAIERDYGDEFYYYGGRCPRMSVEHLQGWSCSRFLLEWQIRQDLVSFHNLTIMEGYEVLGLLGHTEAVHGVQFRARNCHGENEFQSLDADLVVDASGRSSRSIKWLEDLGYQAPQETVLSTGIGYATCLYDSVHPIPFIGIQSTQQHRRGGVLMTVEGRVMVGLTGDCPPLEKVPFLEFIKSLPDSALYDAVKDASPISPIYGYRQTENRLRHFDRLQRYPEQFLVMGDAVCTFNPIYGQGMAVAMLEALELRRCLHSYRKRKGFAHTFQKRVARIIALPWQLATASEKEGTSWFLGWYLERLITILPSDQRIWLTFLAIIHMVKGPMACFHPVILAKVIAHRRKPDCSLEY